MLERSCAALAAWLHDTDRVPIGIAVNVSARQLVSGDLVRTVEHALKVADLDPTSLVLEMTENLLIEDSERAMRVIADLRHLGVRIALDDFGTGYSSLSYLTKLPIDIVKIDQSLIAGIVAGPESVVVSATTRLAHELGMVVIAEGIETREQHDEVVRIGCDHSQGFSFGRPMSDSAIQGLEWTLPLPSAVSARSGQHCP